MRILCTFVGGHGHLTPLPGGSGNLMAALAHGPPSVLLPLGADQPHNALRARELGVASTLDAATATAADITRGVSSALADAPMAERCRGVAAEIGSLPSVESAVALLERTADGPRVRP